MRPTERRNMPSSEDAAYRVSVARTSKGSHLSRSSLFCYRERHCVKGNVINFSWRIPCFWLNSVLVHGRGLFADVMDGKPPDFDTVIRRTEEERRTLKNISLSTACRLP